VGCNAPLHCSVAARSSPWRSLELAGHTPSLEIVKHAGSLVGKLCNIIREVIGGPEMVYHVFPIASPEK
jgi:hypothetical protein